MELPNVLAIFSRLAGTDADAVIAEAVEGKRAALKAKLSEIPRGRAVNRKMPAGKLHASVVSVHSMYYNLCRAHKALCMSPAMAAGITVRPWDMDNLVALEDANDPTPKRGPHQK